MNFPAAKPASFVAEYELFCAFFAVAVKFFVKAVSKFSDD
jgi:hypothetical protein